MKRYIVSSNQPNSFRDDNLRSYFEQNLNQYEGYHWEVRLEENDDEWYLCMYLCKDSNNDAVYADCYPIDDEDEYMASTLAWQDRRDIVAMENQYLDEENFTSEDFDMKHPIQR